MLLKINNLGKIYHSGKIEFKALTDINLEIKKGDFCAISGPSGSGKTTLLNIIGCIDQASSGAITINEELISDKNKNELAFYRRQYFGFIFQTYNLIPVLNVYENVEISLKILKQYTDKEIKTKVEAMLNKVGLADFHKHKPGELSGGQQQRVAIARALIKNPTLVLADEPTANLDTETGEKIIDLMRTMNKKEGITFIFSTHDEIIKKHANHVINIRDGKIC